MAEAAAAAPQTPPTSSETGLFVQPAPAAMQASLADHVGPVTPPPGSSSQVPPAPGSAQLRAPTDDSAQAAQPAQDDVKMGQVWLLCGALDVFMANAIDTHVAVLSKDLSGSHCPTGCMPMTIFSRHASCGW